MEHGPMEGIIPSRKAGLKGSDRQKERAAATFAQRIKVGKLVTYSNSPISRTLYALLSNNSGRLQITQAAFPVAKS